MAVRKSPPVSSPAAGEPAAEKPVSRPRTRGVSRPPVEAKPALPLSSTDTTVAPEKPVEPVKQVNVSATPESSEPAKKRKRLSKAFSRPLDKILMKQAKPVRERFTLLRGEYDQLVRIKKQLADQGVEARKSDLVRAALSLLSAKSDEEIKALLEIMAYGKTAEGYGLEAPEVRSQFTRESVLASDWYAARLDAKQRGDEARVREAIAADIEALSEHGPYRKA